MPRVGGKRLLRHSDFAILKPLQLYGNELWTRVSKRIRIQPSYIWNFQSIPNVGRSPPILLTQTQNHRVTVVIYDKDIGLILEL
jgi:hypothetical protein